MFVALLALAAAASSQENKSPRKNEPISKGQELGITLGIEFGLVTLGVICFFTFFRSPAGVDNDLTGQANEDSHSESSEEAKKPDDVPAQSL